MLYGRRLKLRRPRVRPSGRGLMQSSDFEVRRMRHFDQQACARNFLIILLTPYISGRRGFEHARPESSPSYAISCRIKKRHFVAEIGMLARYKQY